MGYSQKQITELEATINRAEVDTVIVATPMDLSRVTYEVEEEGSRLIKLLNEFESRWLS
jgi:predicted GTPase